ncbi:MAG: hypothetical protein ABJB93_04200 [Gaiellales bacterium]
MTYPEGVLHRIPTPVRALLTVAAGTLLWRVIGSASWLKDVGFAIWLTVIAEGIQWFDRRRKRQSAAG